MVTKNGLWKMMLVEIKIGQKKEAHVGNIEICLDDLMINGNYIYVIFVNMLIYNILKPSLFVDFDTSRRK